MTDNTTNDVQANNQEMPKEELKLTEEEKEVARDMAKGIVYVMSSVAKGIRSGFNWSMDLMFGKSYRNDLESVSTAAKKEESSSPRLGWPNKKEDILNKQPTDNSFSNTSFPKEKGMANNDEPTNNSGVDSQLRKAGQVLSPEEQDRINTILSEKSQNC
ncbi:MAG: hypothetical protein IJY58_03705 [Alphaproteobacteria bacterium]|nr:hypothetical protein [Alphaproteobacteria bacterium]